MALAVVLVLGVRAMGKAPALDAAVAAAAIVPTVSVGAHADFQASILRNGSIAFAAADIDGGLAHVQRLQTEPYSTVTEAWVGAGGFAIGGATVRVELYNGNDVTVKLVDARVMQQRVPEPQALAVVTPRAQGGGEVVDLYFDLDSPDPRPLDFSQRGEEYFDNQRPEIPPHTTLSVTMRLALDHGATEARVGFDFVGAGVVFSKDVEMALPVRITAFDCGLFVAEHAPWPERTVYDRVVELVTEPFRPVERVPPFVREDPAALAAECPGS
ncbi:hypothetical protein [Nocardia farcinica]|nr:hypothetical protein [Nocardia farcinica]